MDSVISIHTYLTNAIMTIDIPSVFFPWPMYLTTDTSILLLNVHESAHENEVLNSPKSDETSTDATELNVSHTENLRAPFSNTKLEDSLQTKKSEANNHTSPHPTGSKGNVSESPSDNPTSQDMKVIDTPNTTTEKNVLDTQEENILQQH